MKLPYILNSFYRFFRWITPDNIKPYVRGYYNRLNKYITYKRSDIFTALDIEINSKCNLKCSYCPVSNYDRGNHFMSRELYKKIINDIKEFDVMYEGRISPHFYNEPLLDKRIVEFIQYTRKELSQAEIIIHSNGILLNEALLKQLIAAGTNGIIISKHLKDYPQNVLKLMRNSEYKKYIKLQNLKKQKLFNRAGEVDLEKKLSFKKCFYVSDEIAIDYNGEVVCTNDFKINNSFGNVKNQKLKDIWFSQKFTNFRKDVAKGIFKYEMCKKCTN